MGQINVNNKIGIFDSGVGGLTILRAIQERLLNENLLYLADQAHVPYGPRQLDQIRKFSKGIVKYFISRGIEIIVVACNTASAAALYYLRDEFPDIIFVGMEPALKPAAEITETGVVGVLATEATFQGELYASVVERFATEVQLIQEPCVGLVEQIEAGDIGGSKTRNILEKALKPMIQANIDTVVLGCTHFPFVFPAIENIVGPRVRLINPAPAVAQQVELMLNSDVEKTGSGEVEFLTTGEIKKFSNFLNKFGFNGKTEKIEWGKELVL